MALSRTLVILFAIVFGLFAVPRWPLRSEPLVSAPMQEPAKVITILHTNDIHGHLMPWPGWEGTRRGQTHQRTLIPLIAASSGSGAASDDPMEDLIARLRAPFAPVMEARIGRALSLIARAQTIAAQEPEARNAESPADDLFADAIRETSGTELAFLPGLGYGVAIPPGDITAAQLRNLIPHDSAIWTMRMTGAQVREVLEQAIENFTAEDATKKVGGMIQVSGLRFTYDSKAPRGSRVLDVTVGARPLRENGRYRVATNALLAEGGHNYRPFTEAAERREMKGLDQYEVVRAWIARRGDVAPPATDRIMNKDAADPGSTTTTSMMLGMVTGARNRSRQRRTHLNGKVGDDMLMMDAIRGRRASIGNASVARAIGFLSLALLAMGSTVAAQRGAPAGGLHVYGPGGPLAPMKACAEQFARKTKIPVDVVGGPEAEWIDSAQRDADLVFGGAEYMLTAFDLRHPRFLDATTRVSLFDRAVGVLVRTGNPRQIRSLKDLTRNGIQIVDVNGAGQLGLWEDLAGRQGLIRDIQRNIRVSVETSADAIALWKAGPELDAWITYESWHFRLPDVTELVRLPEAERLYRGTPIAIARRSTRKADAAALIAHLQSADCHAVFRRWGWR